ncbi:MAG: small multi-drug export protein, partial [Planctomycetes bacterium]|nr:small multi-drug export protein [Planctomycetota bacterium]
MRARATLAETAEAVGPGTRAFFLLFPVVATLAGLGGIYLWSGWPAVIAIATAMLVTFFALGKFAVLASLGHEDWLPAGVPEAFLSPWALAGMVAYMDMMTGLLVAYNLDLLYRIPVLGSRLVRVRENAVAILAANRWLSRIAVLGVVLFVAFPLTGTGAVGGTFVGKIVGLRRRTTLACIATGALFGSFGLAMGAHYLEREFEAVLENPYFVGGSVVV